MVSGTHPVGPRQHPQRAASPSGSEVVAMRNVVLLLGLAFAILVAPPGEAFARHRKHAVVERLAPVNNSGVTGIATLVQLKNGTGILVVARGLDPGTRYVSLYYDNATCQLEPYSEEDVIGGPYVANRGGVATTRGVADDDLDEIHSVSVRLASDFTLLACASLD
jgi:hypothetical protein